MATELAKAYVQIIPSAEGIQGSITSVLSGEAESAGKSAGSKLSSVLGSAAKVGVASVAAMGTAIAGAGKALVSAAGDVAVYGDNIDKMSQKLGISAEAYQEWDFIAQHSGTSMESLKTSFKTLATQAQSGSAEFEKLGISLEEASKMSTEDLFGAVVSGLQGMAEGTERTAIASKLLGKGAVELGALLNTSAADTEAMRQQIHELGGVMSNEAVKDAAAYQDSLQNMQVAMSGLKNSMISSFLPSLTKVMDGISAIVSGDNSGLNVISEGISNLIDNISTMAPQMMQVGATLIQTLGQAILTNLPMIVESAVPIIMSLADGILQNLPTILQVLMDALPTILVMIVDMIPSLVMTIVDAVIQSLPILIDGVITLVLALVEHLPEIIIELINSIPTIIDKVVEALINSLPQLILGAVQLVIGLVQAIPEIIVSLITAIPQIIVAIVNGFKDLGPKLKEAFSQAFTSCKEAWANAPEFFAGLWTKIKDVFSNVGSFFQQKFMEGVAKIKVVFGAIVDFFKGIWTKIKEVFAGVVDYFQDIGHNIVEGIKNGIAGAWDKFTGWLDEKVGGLIDGVKGLFGIESPSKVFAEIGDYCVQGFNRGFETFGDQTIKKVRGTIDDINHTLDSEYGFNSRVTSELALANDQLGVSATVGTNSTYSQILSLLNTYLPVMAEDRETTVTLQGDAKNIFSAVRNENYKLKKATGYHALA